MRVSILISIIVSVLLLGNSPSIQAQAVIQGLVTDAETGQPLRGAHVYLSGTKTGTATSARGQYRLHKVPVGGYRMVISMIGYGTQVVDVIIGPGESKTMDFELESVVYELPEIRVGNRDKDWEKNLERFTHHFIGQSEWADSVEILNPEVLYFDKSWWGRMSAEARAPLKIKNHALGYNITYHLEEFNHSGGRTRWDGEPLFSDMEPADSAQAAYWKRNRIKAFYGSLRHFMLALLADRVKEEGFVVYNYRQGVYGYSNNRSRISPGRLLDEADEDYLYKMNFFGRLEIIYWNEAETPAYLRWQKNNRRGPVDSQTSYLELNEHPITVDEDGEIIQPYGATQFGYFAYDRLAHLTPREYRPEGYGSSAEE